MLSSTLGIIDIDEGVRSRDRPSCRRAFPGVSLVPPGCRVPHDGLAGALCLLEYGRCRWWRLRLSGGFSSLEGDQGGVQYGLSRRWVTGVQLYRVGNVAL